MYCKNPRTGGILRLGEILARSPTERAGSGPVGLVTRRQIDAAGIGPTTVDRLTQSGAELERVAHGVYQLAGTPIPDHRDLRAAWLQLAPEVPAWKRTADQGVVSHRSAAALYGVGNLPADRHEFTVPTRRQTRRPDLRIHVRSLSDGEWLHLGVLPVTRPSRIASDLLWDHEDPEGVANIVAGSIRGILDYPGTFADNLALHASRFGLRKGDGLGLLRWLIGLVGDSDGERWMEEARVEVGRVVARHELVLEY